MENPVIERLSKSGEPCIRYLLARDYYGRNVGSAELKAMQEEIRLSPRVQKMLEPQQEDGKFPWKAYSKWIGAFWTLLQLMDIGYPAGDTSLTPLRDQVLEWLLNPLHINKVPLINGRWRRCALQEATAVLTMLKLGIVDDRITELVESLLKWQWSDGGWNCDKKPQASHSSFYETWLPVRAMHAYAVASGDPRVKDSAVRAGEVFLSHHLYKRKNDGVVISDWFTRLAYPAYWHYDILVGLMLMDEIGKLSDPRCKDALDLLESKRLLDGGFRAEAKYYKVSQTKIEGSGVSFVDWGTVSKSKMNEFVTVNAISILKKAGRAV